MKNLVLASALGTLAGAFAIPALGGPVHYQITRPYSLFGWLPAASGGNAASITLGTAPLDFILTDVMVGGIYERVFVTVNGNPVFNCGHDGTTWNTQTTVHMTSGIFIPAGSAIGVQATYSIASNATPVTLAGYVQ